jgi:predicted secreted Zn-dependent protease
MALGMAVARGGGDGGVVGARARPRVRSRLAMIPPSNQPPGPQPPWPQPPWPQQQGPQQQGPQQQGPQPPWPQQQGPQQPWPQHQGPQLPQLRPPHKGSGAACVVVALVAVVAMIVTGVAVVLVVLRLERGAGAQTEARDDQADRDDDEPRRRSKERAKGERAEATAPVRPPAGVEVIESVETYTVTGSTAAELRADVDLRRPTAVDGQRYDASTRWHVNWRYPYDDRGAAGCSTGAVSVTVTVVIQLPEYRPPAGAPARLRDEWNRYATALRQHENGHRDFGVRTGAEVKRELEALGRAGSCALLDAAANRTGNAVVERFVRDERAYDRDTAHGATQGARFPCTPRGDGCDP